MLGPPTWFRAARSTIVVTIGLLLTITAVSARPIAAEAAPSCAAFTTKVYNQVNPSTTAQGLSATAAGYAAFQAKRFSVNKSPGWTAARQAGSSVAGVHRLYRARNQNYFYSLNRAEITRAVRLHGYVDQGIAFYAATSPASCLTPVWSYLHPRGYHRFTSSTAEHAGLVAAGWRKEFTRFYLGDSGASSTFTLAIIPDTQPEVWRAGDPRFGQRTGWLVSNKEELDLRFVTHTGDIVDWDTPKHDHYVRARAALSRLRGKIPFSVTLGNHDTAAVGVGGSAADPPNTWKMVRNTTTSNKYLDQGTEAMAGQYEAGKIDNTFHTFSAGGLKWMMINLELWPRKRVVAWANAVVRAHPKHNVMIATHSYLLVNGSIYQRSDYGETSPQYLYDHLVKLHPNIKMVFSGHTATAGQRQDIGVKGNRINSFLLTMHDKVTNPTRIVEINTKADTVASFVYSPYTSKTYPSYEVKARSARWTR